MRRWLFRNESRRKLFSSDRGCNNSDEKIIVCMDCGKSYRYNGSSTDLICPNCGGRRFEFKSNILTDMGSDENPVDKIFSEKRRLFSSNPLSGLSRSALTYRVPGPVIDEVRYECPDCGEKFSSDENPNSCVICPNCGGDRCVEDVDGCECQQVDFSDVEDELSELLSKYKGKSVSEDDVARELHARGIYDEVGGVSGLVDSGYADETRRGQVTFSDFADFQRKMFSKLVISVTKEFEIPEIDNRESAIDSLSERLPGKSIMILKRAQSIVEPEVVSFSDTSYLKDSGIESDLKVEYGGKTISMKEFMEILSNEYPDAPEDIIDLLESSKTIKVNGGKVLVSK